MTFLLTPSPVLAMCARVEKFNLRSSAEHDAGGEYPLQDGFGWINGVTRRLLRSDPKHRANRCRAGRIAAKGIAADYPCPGASTSAGKSSGPAKRPGSDEITSAPNPRCARTL
jgi:hypothetical protein